MSKQEGERNRSVRMGYGNARFQVFIEEEKDFFRINGF
jgi:hypothetical protein